MANTLTEQLNELYTTTWINRRDKLIDNIMEATPFFYWLTKKGRSESQSGGRRIEIPLRYEKNETIQGITKGGAVQLTDTDNLTVAYYVWKNITGHIIRYFTEFQQNRSKPQLMNKVNADIDSLQDSYIQKMEEYVLGDGTGDNGNVPIGLQNIIDTTPATGTVGGINAANYSWWRNQATNMTGEAISVYLINRMRTLFNDCGRWGDGAARFPDFLLTTDTVYEAYEEEALEVYRINDKKLADMGFGDCAFKGRPLTWSPQSPAYSMFMINSNHIKWVTDPIENMNLGEWLPIVNQPRDKVAHAMCVCNLTVDNRRKQGVLYNIGN